jgi:hypothetical protein
MFFFPDRNGAWHPDSTSDLFSLLLAFLYSLPMSFYAAPNQQRTLRACMVCSVVQIHNV